MGGEERRRGGEGEKWVEKREGEEVKEKNGWRREKGRR